MANDSGKNVVVADQLEALAIAAKNYTQNEIANSSGSAATFTLNTVPSTVEGTMWLDNSSKKLAVRHNNRIYRLPFEPLAEVTAVNVAPSSVAVMQGQSATATVSAVGNEYISGLSYGLSGAPTWITISDDVILIQPSDNDLGFANVQVYAQDTGSDAMSAAILRAEAKLRPIIESLSVIPPAVTVQQGQSAIAGISAVANEAVTGLSYSLNGASSWVNLNGDYIYVTPTDNDLGTNVLDVIAYDTNSSASAATQFTATAALRPIISAVNVSPSAVAAIQGESTTATISAVANEAVTGLSYSLDGNPDWMNLSGSVILMTPTENDSGSAAVTVTARDTGSTAHAETVFNAAVEELLPEITDITFLPETIYVAMASNSYVTLNAIHNETAKNITYSATSNESVQVSISGNILKIAGIPGTIPRLMPDSSNVKIPITARTGDGKATFVKEYIATIYRSYPPYTFKATPADNEMVTGSGVVTKKITITSNYSGQLIIGNEKVPGASLSVTGNSKNAVLTYKYNKNKTASSSQITAGTAYGVYTEVSIPPDDYYSAKTVSIQFYYAKAKENISPNITIPAAT